MENKRIALTNQIYKDLWLTQLIKFLWNMPLNGVELSLISKIAKYYADIKEQNIEIEELSYDEKLY